MENQAFFFLLLLYNVSSKINKTAEDYINFYTFCLWYFLWLLVLLPKSVCSFHESLSMNCKKWKAGSGQSYRLMVVSGYTQQFNKKIWAIIMCTTTVFFLFSFLFESFNNWERKCIKDLQPKAQQQNLLHTNHTNWGRVTPGPKSEYTQWRRV